MSSSTPSTGQEQQNRLKILEDLQQQKKRLQMQAASTPGPGSQLPAQGRPKDALSGPNRGTADTRNIDQRQRQALQTPSSPLSSPDEIEGAALDPAADDQLPEGGAISDSREVELERAGRFDCGCRLHSGQPCLRQFTAEEIAGLRMDLRALTRGEKDLVLLGIMHACMDRSQTIFTRGRKRKQTKERTRARNTYTVHSKRVCATAFRYLHGISKNKCCAVSAWYKEHGLKPRPKRAGSKTNSDKNLKDRSRLVQFVRAFAGEHAVAAPGRDGSRETEERLVLPSKYSMTGIWRDAYKPAMQQAGFRAVESRTFTKVWHQLCPNVVLKKSLQKARKGAPTGKKGRPALPQNAPAHCPSQGPGFHAEQVLVSENLIEAAQVLYQTLGQ